MIEPGFHSFAGAAGVRTLDLRVLIDDADPPTTTPDIDRAWNDQRRANPRLFNGPILSLTSHDDLTLHTRRDTYQRLTIQSLNKPLVSPPVHQLSVTGVLVARDALGTPHVLLGRRSHATRIYGGLWEFAPGGGVDAPPRTQSSLDGGDLFRQLLQEIREELDLPSPATADLAPGPALGLASDPTAGSVDVVIRVDLLARVEDILTTSGDAERWEYDHARWVTPDELRMWTAQEPTAFIPPAHDIAAFLTAAGLD